MEQKLKDKALTFERLENAPTKLLEKPFCQELLSLDELWVNLLLRMLTPSTFVVFCIRLSFSDAEVAKNSF